MKAIFKLLFFLIAFSCWSQSSSKSIYFVSPSNEINSFKKTSIDFKLDYFDLQIYNPSIGLFENYNYITENQFKRSDKMSLIYSKTPFLSSNVSSLISPFFGNKPDSFNPSGTTDFKSALGVGLINLLLNKSSFSIQH